MHQPGDLQLQGAKADKGGGKVHYAFPSFHNVPVLRGFIPPTLSSEASHHVEIFPPPLPISLQGRATIFLLVWKLYEN